ncbi:hypothetical protein FRB96_008119 [Tulasnella sp. 330]|nr:hypothetical protein FRB96_008119 [Tulasnella sp. 330]
MLVRSTIPAGRLLLRATLAELSEPACADYVPKPHYHIAEDSRLSADRGLLLSRNISQIIANIKNQSVESLALPFLTSWLLGDLTNLVGCILTNQLPFQKYLSSYFCFVDICLVSQYCYYSPAINRYFQQQRHHRGSGAGEDDITTAEVPDTPRVLKFSPQVHFRELSNAAAQVARAAADVAAEYDQQGPSTSGRRRAASMSAAEHSTSTPTGYRKSSSTARDNLDATIPAPEHQEMDFDFEDEDGDEVPAMMYESFRSEDGRGRGTSAVRRSVTSLGSSQPYAASSAFTEHVQGQQPEMTSSGIRGRRPTRQFPESLQSVNTDLEQSLPDDENLSTPLATHIRGSTAATSSWSRSRERGVSRKRATIVFLGVWTLFGIGGVVKIGGADGGGWASVVKRSDEHVGRVWAGRGSPVVGSMRHGSSFLAGGFPRMRGVHPDGTVMLDNDADDSESHRPKPRPQPERPSTKQVIGRISSWMCTVLYLTSRLPQIWKNWIRKSVDGLSMTLFISAFLGNTFYVLSILTNPILNQPAPIPMDYIREAIPFLLGSGGTLLFDVTIVSQMIVYRGRRPKPVRSSSIISGYNSPVRRRSVLRRSTAEDERLLSASGISEGGTQRQASRSRKQYGSFSSVA